MRRVVWLLVVVAVVASSPMSAYGGRLVEPGEEFHCVAVAVGQEDDGELILTPWECFGDPDDRDGRLAVLTASSMLSGAAGGRFDMGALGVDFTLGTHYDGYNGTGSSLTVVGGDCTGGWWNTPSYFSNVISSSYHGCPKLRHYDLPNKGGASWTTTGVGTIKNLTSFNNRTESVQYLP